jgi:hypothetical protein
MNASEFQSARAERIKAFDRDYKALKERYDAALKTAISEQDRASQCVRIKEVLDLNKQLTQLVQNVLVGSEDGGCKLTPERIRALRLDIEKYKEQYAEIQQGRDRVYALRLALSTEEQKVDVAHGSQLLYLGLLLLVLVALVVVVISSGVRNTFNAQSVAPVVSGRFT